MKKYSEIFLEIADSLTIDNWIKQDYFGKSVGDHRTLCMCSHGALQTHINPTVRQSIIDKHDIPVEDDLLRNLRLNILTDCKIAAVRGKETVDQNPSISLQMIWDDRSYWMKESVKTSNKDRGNVEAHFLLGMVGLTTSYNDSVSTRLKDVKEKFKQAAQLAEQLGV